MLHLSVYRDRIVSSFLRQILIKPEGICVYYTLFVTNGMKTVKLYVKYFQVFSNNALNNRPNDLTVSSVTPLGKLVTGNKT